MNLIKRYGFWGFCRLLKDVLLTRLNQPNARLIRRPLYIRGAQFVHIGQSFTCGPGLRLDAFPTEPRTVLSIGDMVQINDHVHIAAIDHVSIGHNTLIASRVFISDHNHGRFDETAEEHGPDTPPALRPLHARPVHIGSNVWIGESACVLPGVTIGDGAIIGAGAVVTRDVPPRCVAAGNPARVTRQYDDATREWKRV